MVTIPTGWAINTATAGDRTSASGFRKIAASLVVQSAPGVPVPGIIFTPGNPLKVTTSASAMTYVVNAGFAVTTRTNQGAYLVGTVSSVTLTVATGDPSNPRYDRIYIVQPDPELAESGQARIDVVVGVAAATPSVPALPTGALELARKLVPAGAANTSSGTALTNIAAYTGLNVSWDTIPNKPTYFPTNAASVADPLNLNVGEINGSKITVSQTAPSSPSTGDVWISW